MNEMTGLIRCPQNTLCFFCQVLEVFTFGEVCCFRLVISFIPETATTPKEKLPIVAHNRGTSQDMFQGEMVATGINLSSYPESPWPGRLLRMIGSEVPKDLWHQMLPTTKTLVRIEFPLRDGGVEVLCLFLWLEVYNIPNSSVVSMCVVWCCVG